MRKHPVPKEHRLQCRQALREQSPLMGLFLIEETEREAKRVIEEVRKIYGYDLELSVIWAEILMHLQAASKAVRRLS